MIHLNGTFPGIKGNPTTNYTITPADKKRELTYMEDCHAHGLDYPPHEPYIGEYPNS